MGRKDAEYRDSICLLTRCLSGHVQAGQEGEGGACGEADEAAGPQPKGAGEGALAWGWNLRVSGANSEEA